MKSTNRIRSYFTQRLADNLKSKTTEKDNLAEEKESSKPLKTYLFEFITVLVLALGLLATIIGSFYYFNSWEPVILSIFTFLLIGSLVIRQEKEFAWNPENTSRYLYSLIASTAVIYATCVSIIDINVIQSWLGTNLSLAFEEKESLLCEGEDVDLSITIKFDSTYSDTFTKIEFLNSKVFHFPWNEIRKAQLITVTCCNTKTSQCKSSETVRFSDGLTIPLAPAHVNNSQSLNDSKSTVGL